MQEIIERIEELLNTVPGDNRVFNMSYKTYKKYFGPENKDQYPVEFVNKTGFFPIVIQEIEDEVIYLINREKVYYCDECGEEIDSPGLCVFCFATASIGG